MELDLTKIALLQVGQIGELCELTFCKALDGINKRIREHGLGDVDEIAIAIEIDMRPMGRMLDDALKVIAGERIQEARFLALAYLSFTLPRRADDDKLPLDILMGPGSDSEILDALRANDPDLNEHDMETVCGAVLWALLAGHDLYRAAELWGRHFCHKPKRWRLACTGLLAERLERNQHLLSDLFTHTRYEFLDEGAVQEHLRQHRND